MEQRDMRKGDREDTWKAAPSPAPDASPDAAQMGTDGESALEMAGIMAEQIRMRADLERLLKENDELRRGQDRVLRLISENAPGRDKRELKEAVKSVLTTLTPADGPVPTTVVGPIPSLDELKVVEERMTSLSGTLVIHGRPHGRGRRPGPGLRQAGGRHRPGPARAGRHQGQAGPDQRPALLDRREDPVPGQAAHGRGARQHRGRPPQLPVLGDGRAHPRDGPAGQGVRQEPGQHGGTGGPPQGQPRGHPEGGALRGQPQDGAPRRGGDGRPGRPTSRPSWASSRRARSPSTSTSAGPARPRAW